METKLVTFDADGTLWDTRKAILRALGETLKRLQQLVPTPEAAALTPARLAEIRDEVASQRPPEGRESTRWAQEIRRQAFTETLKLLGQSDPDLASEITDTYFSYRWQPIEVYSDVVPTLDQLSEHYRLGVITNGFGKFEQSGLSSYFDFLVYAEDHDVEKPDRYLFEVACEQGTCDPSELAHVGDSLVHDAFGAEDVGALGIWLNRNAEPNEFERKPMIEIKSLLELPSVLDPDNDVSSKGGRRSVAGESGGWSTGHPRQAHNGSEPLG